jgi:hypothetical protein
MDHRLGSTRERVVLPALRLETTASGSECSNGICCPSRSEKGRGVQLLGFGERALRGAGGRRYIIGVSRIEPHEIGGVERTAQPFQSGLPLPDRSLQISEPGTRLTRGTCLVQAAEPGRRDLVFRAVQRILVCYSEPADLGNHCRPFGELVRLNTQRRLASDDGRMISRSNPKLGTYRVGVVSDRVGVLPRRSGGGNRGS